MRQPVADWVDAADRRSRLGLVVAALALAFALAALVLILSALIVRPGQTADRPYAEDALVSREQAMADIGAQLLARFPLPSEVDTAAAGVPAKPVPSPTLPVPAAAATDGDHGGRVFVHYSSRTSGGRRAAERMARHLAGAGQAVAEIRVVAFPVSAARVRFFFPGDDDRAQVLARQVAAAGGGRVRIEDFTWFRPLPAPGVIEVWLAGTTDLAARETDR